MKLAPPAFQEPPSSSSLLPSQDGARAIGAENTSGVVAGEKTLACRIELFELLEKMGIREEQLYERALGALLAHDPQLVFDRLDRGPVPDLDGHGFRALEACLGRIPVDVGAKVLREVLSLPLTPIERKELVASAVRVGSSYRDRSPLLADLIEAQLISAEEVFRGLPYSQYAAAVGAVQEGLVRIEARLPEVVDDARRTIESRLTASEFVQLLERGGKEAHWVLQGWGAAGRAVLDRVVEHVEAFPDTRAHLAILLLTSFREEWTPVHDAVVSSLKARPDSIAEGKSEGGVWGEFCGIVENSGTFFGRDKSLESEMISSAELSKRLAVALGNPACKLTEQAAWLIGVKFRSDIVGDVLGLRKHGIEALDVIREGFDVLDAAIASGGLDAPTFAEKVVADIADRLGLSTSSLSNLAGWAWYSADVLEVIGRESSGYHDFARAQSCEQEVEWKETARLFVGRQGRLTDSILARLSDDDCISTLVSEGLSASRQSTCWTALNKPGVLAQVNEIIVENVKEEYRFASGFTDMPGSAINSLFVLGKLDPYRGTRMLVAALNALEPETLAAVGRHVVDRGRLPGLVSMMYDPARRITETERPRGSLIDRFAPVYAFTVDIDPIDAAALARRLFGLAEGLRSQHGGGDQDFAGGGVRAGHADSTVFASVSSVIGTSPEKTVGLIDARVIDFTDLLREAHVRYDRVGGAYRSIDLDTKERVFLDHATRGDGETVAVVHSEWYGVTGGKRVKLPLQARVMMSSLPFDAANDGHPVTMATPDRGGRLAVSYAMQGPRPGSRAVRVDEVAGAVPERIRELFGADRDLAKQLPSELRDAIEESRKIPEVSARVEFLRREVVTRYRYSLHANADERAQSILTGPLDGSRDRLLDAIHATGKPPEYLGTGKCDAINHVFRIALQAADILAISTEGSTVGEEVAPGRRKVSDIGHMWVSVLTLDAGGKPVLVDVDAVAGMVDLDAPGSSTPEAGGIVPDSRHDARQLDSTESPLASVVLSAGGLGGRGRSSFAREYLETVGLGDIEDLDCARLFRALTQSFGSSTFEGDEMPAREFAVQVVQLYSEAFSRGLAGGFAPMVDGLLPRESEWFTRYRSMLETETAAARTRYDRLLDEFELPPPL